MHNASSSKSYAFAGYLVMLLGFLFLGLFVVSLAGGIGTPSWPFGVAVAVLFALSIAAFRLQIALSKQHSDDMIIWSDPMTPPLRRADVEQYERTYRRARLAAVEAPATAPADEGTRLYWAA
ncbi:hypothetical protein NWF34_09785 [Gordonia sp. GONU]|uniref:hypothetical protein n=1 Tax=Gordonia sp. GONU TaxID=2972949 RepID=UPI0021AD48C2|nr:hypothetical protein [Gordonia sp. GONU]MCR8897239.1 hypothetical protein [Gordonia sp. GONU]